MVNLDFLSLKSLGLTNYKLDEIADRLETIQKLLELLLNPPDLKEYDKWKLEKRKGLD